MIDEGYIKYHMEWEKSSPLSSKFLSELIHWRQIMYAQQWIGLEENLGVGYGNISQRSPENPDTFIISGTQTGHIPELTPIHFTTVTAYNLSANTIHCRGPIKASSESLTHAALYALDPHIQAVIHIHENRAWENLCFQIPTTAQEVAYGTPEMAFEVEKLYRETLLPKTRLLAMAGHEGGLVSFGETLEKAGKVLLEKIKL